MEDRTQVSYSFDRLIEGSGCLHIFRAFRGALQPTKLIIALAAILVTCLYGALLDACATGLSKGSAMGEVDRYIFATRTGEPYQPQEGDYGPFAIWREHERHAVLGLLGSSIPGTSLAEGSPVVGYVERYQQHSLLGNLTRMVYGVWWLFTQHLVYFLFFGLGSLFVWSLAGGAISRVAALQFARDEDLSFKQALSYAWNRIGALFLAPCFPLGLIALFSLGLALFGLVMRIPVLGDLLSIVIFPICVFLGFVILAPLVLGMFAGGCMFWPAVSVDGADAFNAFSRALAYTLPKPWKTVLYALITLVYAAICFVLVNLFTYLSLRLTRAAVSFGTAPFGAFEREEGVSKMELLWPMTGPHDLYSWPGLENLSWPEYLSALVVALTLVLVIGLLWSFLTSFFLTSSTIAYTLLRRDVDGTDLEEVYMEEPEEPTVSSSELAGPGAEATNPSAESTGPDAEPVAPSPGPAETPAPTTDAPEQRPDQSDTPDSNETTEDKPRP